VTRRKRVPADPTKAVAYLRASTDRQDLSPDAQRAAVIRWAAAQGVVVVAWHEDLGVSGGTPLEERPGLLAALDAVRAHGAGVLLVARRDRLARDVLTAALVERLCEREGARVQAADGAGNGDGPEAQLLRGIVDLFAQYERAVIRARTKAALAVKKARGERTGGVPMGSRVGEGGMLAANDVERGAVERARELRGEGKSLRQIARALVAEGYAPRGKRWHAQTLARVVAAP
jgi:DNA invertase Pin-like site-specific DNA recombinase